MTNEVHYHYTTVEALFKIVKHKKFRLSNILFLNDSMEFEWLWRKVKKEIARRMTGNATENERKFLGELRSRISRWRRSDEDTGGMSIPYVFCGSFSELKDDLSQWRGYADDGRGVAIGVDLPSITSATKNHNLAWPCQVIYNESENRQKVSEILTSFVEQAEKGVPVSEALSRTYRWLAREAATRKNPAFKKEKEFRLVLYHPLANSLLGEELFEKDLCTINQRTPDVKYRCRAGRITPFIPVEFPITAIRDLWLGPRFGGEKEKAALQQFLGEKRGL